MSWFLRKGVAVLAFTSTNGQHHFKKVAKYDAELWKKIKKGKHNCAQLMRKKTFTIKSLTLALLTDMLKIQTSIKPAEALHLRTNLSPQFFFQLQYSSQDNNIMSILRSFTLNTGQIRFPVMQTLLSLS